LPSSSSPPLLLLAVVLLLSLPAPALGSSTCDPQSFARAVPPWLEGLLPSGWSPLTYPQPMSLAPPACAAFATCSCCGARHTRAVALFLAAAASAATSADSDSSFSPACLDTLERFACRPCDPRGPPLPVCSSLCDAALQACAGDFFAVDAATGVATPCAASQLVCTALRDLASSGAELCGQLLALPVAASGEKCYDGLPPPAQEARRVCDEAAASRRRAGASAASSRSSSSSSSLSSLVAKWRKRLIRNLRNRESRARLLPPLLAFAGMIAVHLVLGRGGGGGGGRRRGGGRGGQSAEQAAAAAALQRERLAERLAAAAELRHRRADEELRSLDRE